VSTVTRSRFNFFSIAVPDGNPDPRTHRSIVLVGFMAAGKSRIGRLLAKRLNLPFVDSDSRIEELYRRSVAEIFGQLGEAEFRRAEREVISRLLSEEAQVIAVGGGAFIDDEPREALNRQAVTVWLDAPIELVLARLGRSESRPLAANKSEEEIRALWNHRHAHYAQAHLRIATGDRDPERVVDQIIAELR
jgi:shikimate kinase